MYVLKGFMEKCRDRKDLHCFLIFREQGTEERTGLLNELNVAETYARVV